MPRQIGTKAKVIAEQAAIENAALETLKNATDAEQLAAAAQSLSEARKKKLEANDLPEEEFFCAWHQGTFTGPGKAYFEVSGHFETNENGETVTEERHTREPMYLIACLDCEKKFGLIAHLKE